MRTRVPAAAVVLMVGLSACGSSRTSAGAPTSGPGPLTGFGATASEWNSHHQADPAKARGTAYLPSVGGADQFTAVTVMSDRVIAYDLRFPAGTTLAATERFVLQQLPPDATQVASFKAKTVSGTGSCLLVNYQSPTLAKLLSGGPFDDPLGAVGAYLETAQPGGPAEVLDVADVNAGGISLGWNRGTDPC